MTPINHHSGQASMRATELLSSLHTAIARACEKAGAGAALPRTADSGRPSSWPHKRPGDEAPVGDQHVEAAMPFLTKQLASVVQLQLVTGDVNREGEKRPKRKLSLQDHSSSQDPAFGSKMAGFGPQRRKATS